MYLPAPTVVLKVCDSFLFLYEYDLKHNLISVLKLHEVNTIKRNRHLFNGVQLSGVAVVFEREPLCKHQNCLSALHVGSEGF